MISAIENYNDTIEAQKNIAETNRIKEEKHQKKMAENAKYHCENFITQNILKYKNLGYTSISFEIIQPYSWSEDWRIVKYRGYYNSKSGGYYDPTYYGEAFDLDTMTSYLKDNGYSVYFNDQPFEEATTQYGKYNASNKTKKVIVDWSNPNSSKSNKIPKFTVEIHFA